MKLESGDVAVITGGASGIGFGLAEAVVARGGRVVISDIRADAAEAAASSLRRAGAEAVAVSADVADAESVRALAEAAVYAFGSVQLLCNNAGLVSPSAALWEQAPQTWERMIQVKIMGVVNGVRAFAPHLIAQGRGHILNTASSGGLAPLPTRSPYTATMHAVVGLTETLNLELRQAAPGVGATVLCPGLVDTPLGENSALLGAIDLPPGTPNIRSMGRSFLTPAEVAEAALAAMDAGIVHVAPGEGVLERAQERVNALLADLAVSSVAKVSQSR
jgi:NAD(P)-dependent dehydrogenase (short-subunit alcohol dehydrogenase family)